MRVIRLAGLLCLLALSGCYSMGSVGMITKSSMDPVAFVQKPHTVTDLGPAEGKACRYFAAAVVPWGKSDLQTAVDKALESSGGDALVNVSESSSLYGFVPVYNVFSFTCTTVMGRAVKFDTASAAPVAPAAQPPQTSAQPESSGVPTGANP